MPIGRDRVGVGGGGDTLERVNADRVRLGMEPLPTDDMLDEALRQAGFKK